MKRQIINILHWIIGIICWFTISPLFYYYTRRYNLIGRRTRIPLLLISPMLLIIYMVIFIYGIDAYNNYQRKYRLTSRETLERITGITYPDFKIVEYSKDKSSFLGDYNDRLTIEFIELPTDAFYMKIDSLIATNNSEWFKHENTYTYSKMWGNGLSVPKGEDDNEDMSFSIRLEKGSKQAILDYGAW
ncbi:hypothetical protein QVN91_01900 [Bacteroides caecigallinarum]|nr:hypothetical protein [Bacteroides caecigallinarum]